MFISGTDMAGRTKVAKTNEFSCKMATRNDRITHNLPLVPEKRI